MKVKGKLLLSEMALLVASIFIFRGLWMLLDKLPFMHDAFALWLSLIFGVAVAIPSIRYIIRKS